MAKYGRDEGDEVEEDRLKNIADNDFDDNEEDDNDDDNNDDDSNSDISDDDGSGNYRDQDYASHEEGNSKSGNAINGGHESGDSGHSLSTSSFFLRVSFIQKSNPSKSYCFARVLKPAASIITNSLT